MKPFGLLASAAALGVAASVTPALAFGCDAPQMTSLTADLVTAKEGLPNPGGNYVCIYPAFGPPGYYSDMLPLAVGRSVAIYHRPER